MADDNPWAKPARAGAGGAGSSSGGAMSSQQTDAAPKKTAVEHLKAAASTLAETEQMGADTLE